MALDERQHARADNVQDGFIAPFRLGDEVMQRLVGRLNALRAAIGSTLLRLPGSSSPVQ
jgi:hypothetical protein